MSEQEKNTSGNVPDGSSVVMIESAGRHKQPFRPTGLHESSPELHHKHSKAPAVPSVAEELKDATESSETKERKESERAISSDKHKHSVARKLSTNIKRRGASPEAITLEPLEVDTKKGTITSSPQPIPAQVSAVVSEESGLAMEKPAASDIEKKYDDDSITEEILESRTPEVVKRSSEWSDEEEASGLPRSDSRGSRVSRVVRQLFCCGATYEAASEHQLSPRGYTNGI